MFGRGWVGLVWYLEIDDELIALNVNELFLSPQCLSMSVDCLTKYLR